MTVDVALCIIATGKYHQFVGPLLQSARRFFLRGQSLHTLVFGDVVPETHEDFSFYKTTHQPWPMPTLRRYHEMLRGEAEIWQCDYAFYIDADMLFVDPVGEEILGPGLTAVRHPGFDGRPRATFTYEQRHISTAYISPLAGSCYYAGGFQGGRVDEWVGAMKSMRDNIDVDTNHGIVAWWHDESHWNHHLVDCPPAVSLSPDYCCPQTWMRPERKILALDKNHAQMRA